MKIYRTGEKSKGLCSSCIEVVPTKFELVSVPLSSSRGNVDDIIAAVCQRCHHVVSIPQQSAPRIREKLNRRKRSIEICLSRHRLDILILASDKFNMGSPELLKDSLVRYYIGIAAQEDHIIDNVKKFSESEFAKGAGCRLSLKVNEVIYHRFEQLIKSTGLKKTQVLKGLILQINQDILQSPTKKKRIQEVEKVLLASA